MRGLFDLTDQVAVITGSSRGIGRAIAEALGRTGRARGHFKPQPGRLRGGGQRYKLAVRRGQDCCKTTGKRCHQQAPEANPVKSRDADLLAQCGDRQRRQEEDELVTGDDQDRGGYVDTQLRERRSAGQR